MKVDILLQFSPSFWYSHFGYRFDESYYLDVNNRIQVNANIKDRFMEMFPGIPLEAMFWGAYETSIFQSNLIVEVLCGKSLCYVQDQRPWSPGKALNSKDEIAQFQIPDFSSHPFMSVLLEQLEALSKIYGPEKIDIFGCGPNAKCHSELVLGIALAGPEIMEYMIEEPNLVHSFLQKLDEMNLGLIQFFAKKQARRIEQVFISDCAGVMLSPKQYEIFGIRYKNELLTALGARCALHGCGNVAHLLGLYPQLVAFSWLEAGYGTDIEKLLVMLDEVGINRVDFLLDPAHLMETSEEELREEWQHLVNIVQPRALRLRTGPMEYGTPTENISALYSIASENSENPIGHWSYLRENY